MKTIYFQLNKTTIVPQTVLYADLIYFFNRLFLFFCCKTSTLDAVIFLYRFFSKKFLHSGRVEKPCHTTWHAPIMCCCVATYLLNSGNSVYSCWGLWSSSYTYKQELTFPNKLLLRSLVVLHFSHIVRNVINFRGSCLYFV